MWYKKGFFSFGRWREGNPVSARKKTYTEKVMIIKSPKYSSNGSIAD